MINDLHIGDGTWELRIFVTDLKTERLLRVKGDLHIGGLMLKLVEDLDMAIDWSDHALWWPKKKCWLTRTRSTLDQCGVQADALLHFTPMHKTCRIQLPDLRYIDYRVDFSIKCFTSVVKLCKEFGIRHPEELSFCRPLVNENLKKNQQKIGVTAKQRGEYVPTKNGLNNLMNTSNNSKKSTSISSLIDNRVQNMPTHNDKTPTPVRNGNGYIHGNNLSNQNGFSTLVYNLNAPSTTTPLTTENIYSNELTLPDLSQSPSYVTGEAKNCLLKPKTLQEKARMNVAWLDSSLSLYEQNIEEFDLILLRYKYLSFYDLNSKIDGVRINQIYEQARWSLINEHVECTEAEMYMFAGLQLQINLPTINPDLVKDNLTNSQLNKQTSVDEEIDSALTELQLQLEGVSLTDSRVKNLTKFNQNSSSNNITHIPELTDYLKLIKAKRFTLKSFKQYYFVFKDTRLICYKNREERGGQPILTINLKGAEVTPEVNLSQGKYSVKLEVPDYSYNNLSQNNNSFNSSSSMGSMNEYWLRFSNEEQYARWLGAFKLAVEGRTMADAVNYENEVKQIIDLLSMQHPVLHSGSNKTILNQSYVHDIPLEDYMATKFLRKVKSRSHILQRILEANANVKNLSQIDAKLKYIKAWQALPDFGVSLFVVKFADSKKEELLGVASNRIMRMDLHTGDHIKTWNFSSMKSWNVNWEIKQMQVQFEDDNVRFHCLSADCKVVHEFIGGYIFLSMRSKEQNQTLNEELFHKLTGVLLVCSSLVFAKPANKNPLNFLNIISNIGFEVKNFGIYGDEACDDCYNNYKEWHDNLQNPEAKLIMLAWAIERCPDIKCVRNIEAFIASVSEETDPKEGCKPVCNQENLLLELVKENNMSNEAVSIGFPKLVNNLFSIWDKLACSQCHKYHIFLHEAFKDPLYKKRYLEFGKNLCPNKDCLVKLEALVKSISKETEERKACKPVCDA